MRDITKYVFYRRKSFVEILDLHTIQSTPLNITNLSDLVFTSDSRPSLNIIEIIFFISIYIKHRSCECEDAERHDSGEQDRSCFL